MREPKYLRPIKKDVNWIENQCENLHTMFKNLNYTFWWTIRSTLGPSISGIKWDRDKHIFSSERMGQLDRVWAMKGVTNWIENLKNEGHTGEPLYLAQVKEYPPWNKIVLCEPVWSDCHLTQQRSKWSHDPSVILYDLSCHFTAEFCNQKHKQLSKSVRDLHTIVFWLIRTVLPELAMLQININDEIFKIMSALHV